MTQALLGDPGLLVLDEAWTGLDAAARAELAAVVQERARDGACVVRMANGLKPDVTAFAARTTWLRMPAESFHVGGDDDPADQPEPELVASLGPLLRARRDLTEGDVAYLEEVNAAAARRFNAERGDRSS